MSQGAYIDDTTEHSLRTQVPYMTALWSEADKIQELENKIRQYSCMTGCPQ